MNEKDFQAIEGSLSIVLPEYYKSFMLNYPEELMTTSAQDFELNTDSSRLIEENQSAYKDFYWERPLPRDYFIIGENGCGDYFIIGLKTDFGVVSFFHDHDAFYKVAKNLKEYSQKSITGKIEDNWGNKQYLMNDLRK